MKIGKVKSERMSNFEMLRIVSMIAIVLFHYVGHGSLAYQSFSVNQVLAQFLKIGGKLGVNCFVMISAWFLVDSKFSFRKLVSVAGQTTFYALMTVGLKYLAGGGYSVAQIIKCIFAPVYEEIYWFPVTYIGLYLLFPFINSILHNNQEIVKKLCGLLTIVLCGIQFFFLNSNYLFSNILWFIYLYMIIGLIKLNPNHDWEKRAILYFWLSVMLIFLSSLSIKTVGVILNSKFIEDHCYYVSAP